MDVSMNGSMPRATAVALRLAAIGLVAITTANVTLAQGPARSNSARIDDRRTSPDESRT